MAYVKLDTGILNSTLWIDLPQSRVFITALLLAEPMEFHEPVETFEINEMRHSEFAVPPGWYGFVAASGPGLIHHAQIGAEAGTKALKQLSEPEADSRSSDFEGRRMVRVDGGFLILNYMKYRDKDHTAAQRQRRLRDRKRHGRDITELRVTSVTRDAKGTRSRATSRIADADADADLNPPTPLLKDSRSEQSLDLQVHEIAALYPKIDDAFHLSREVEEVIAAAIVRDGRDVVWVGTKSMAEQVARWPKSEHQFIPSAPRYFGESQYRKDPEFWNRSNGHGKGKPTNAIRDSHSSESRARYARDADIVVE